MSQINIEKKQRVVNFIRDCIKKTLANRSVISFTNVMIINDDIYELVFSVLGQEKHDPTILQGGTHEDLVIHKIRSAIANGDNSLFFVFNYQDDLSYEINVSIREKAQVLGNWDDDVELIKHINNRKARKREAKKEIINKKLYNIIREYEDEGVPLSVLTQRSRFLSDPEERIHRLETMIDDGLIECIMSENNRTGKTKRVYKTI